MQEQCLTAATAATAVSHRSGLPAGDQIELVNSGGTRLFAARQQKLPRRPRRTELAVTARIARTAAVQGLHRWREAKRAPASFDSPEAAPDLACRAWSASPVRPTRACFVRRSSALPGKSPGSSFSRCRPALPEPPSAPDRRVRIVRRANAQAPHRGAGPMTASRPMSKTFRGNEAPPLPIKQFGARMARHCSAAGLLISDPTAQF